MDTIEHLIVSAESKRFICGAVFINAEGESAQSPAELRGISLQLNESLLFAFKQLIFLPVVSS